MNMRRCVCASVCVCVCVSVRGLWVCMWVGSLISGWSHCIHGWVKKLIGVTG